MILEKINLEFKKFKTKIKISFRRPIVSGPDVLPYLSIFIDNVAWIR